MRNSKQRASPTLHDQSAARTLRRASGTTRTRPRMRNSWGACGSKWACSAPVAFPSASRSWSLGDGRMKAKSPSSTMPTDDGVGSRRLVASHGDEQAGAVPGAVQQLAALAGNRRGRDGELTPGGHGHPPVGRSSVCLVVQPTPAAAFGPSGHPGRLASTSGPSHLSRDRRGKRHHGYEEPFVRGERRRTKCLGEGRHVRDEEPGARSAAAVLRPAGTGCTPRWWRGLADAAVPVGTHALGDDEGWCRRATRRGRTSRRGSASGRAPRPP